MDWCEGVRFRKVAYLLLCLLGFLNLLCKTVDRSLLFVWFLQATFLIGELCYPVVDHMFRWNFPRYLFFQLFQNLGGMFMWQLGARCYLQGSNLALPPCCPFCLDLSAFYYAPNCLDLIVDVLVPILAIPMHI